jgi:putrescine aminotransferase
MTTLTVDEAARSRCLGLYRSAVNPGLAAIASMIGAPLEIRSQGSIVYAEHYAEYLDCGGYGVFFLGHSHPRVVGRVAEQLFRHPLSVRGMLEPRLAEASAALVGVAPSGLDYATMTCSGSEAVELALKLARANGRRRVLAMENGYHGKTLGALSVTGRDRYREPAEPLLPDVEFLPFGDAGALSEVLEKGRPACVIVEPIQGEGGVVLPPPGYLSQVRALCDKFGALLIADEVQTGLGRTGRWWGCNAEGVTPDLLTTGKVLSGGVVPVGAVLASPEVMAPLISDPLLHSSTFAGSPLACAAAAATIETITVDNLVGRASELGHELLARATAILHATCPGQVREVRGAGLLIGIECASAPLALELMMNLLEQRVITSYSLNASQVLRLTPPANLSEREVDWLLTALSSAAEALARRP